MSFGSAFGAAQQMPNFPNPMAVPPPADAAAMPQQQQQAMSMPPHQFHPGRRYSPQTHSGGHDTLPHEICRAHLAEPFWWLSQH